MDVNSWHFAQWFTFGAISMLMMFVLVYGLSFMIVNRDMIRAYRAARKVAKTEKVSAWKEPKTCPEWADERRFQATRLEEEE